MRNILLLFLFSPILIFGQNQNRDYFKNLIYFNHGVYALPTSDTSVDDLPDYLLGQEEIPIAFVKIVPNQKTKILVTFR
jgi:hypothetical protein